MYLPSYARHLLGDAAWGEEKWGIIRNLSYCKLIKLDVIYSNKCWCHWTEFDKCDIGTKQCSIQVPFKIKMDPNMENNQAISFQEQRPFILWPAAMPSAVLNLSKNFWMALCLPYLRIFEWPSACFPYRPLTYVCQWMRWAASPVPADDTRQLSVWHLPGMHQWSPAPLVSILWTNVMYKERC